ncbi:hypothetical protein M3Y97_00632600 [Aphelenchoides bicaudatus]|nr:hypothetical protein M3Y97_00632600 [Aphelenchoides bicaudatus]
MCKRVKKCTSHLAKCVSVVLDTRDRLKTHQLKPTDPECVPDESDGNWMTSLIRAIYRKWSCQNGTQTSLSNYSTKENHSQINVSIKGSKQMHNKPKLPVYTTNSHQINKIKPTKQSTSKLSFIGTPNKVQSIPDIILNRRRFYSNWRRARLQYSNYLKIDNRNAYQLPPSPYSNSKSHLNWPSRQRPKKSQQHRLYKRDIRGISPRCLVPENVDMLRTVRRQFEKLNHVVKYFYNVTKSNQKFFESVDMKVEYRDRTPSKHSPLVQAREFAEKLESFEDRDIISILSPKLLTLMPETPDDPGSKRWLSPNMLSFQDEGMLPLPRLLQASYLKQLTGWGGPNSKKPWRCRAPDMSTSNHCETLKWIDLLMDMTGAKRIFAETNNLFGKFMGEVENTMYPRVKEVEVHDGKFERLQQLNSWEQAKQMAEQGYAVMNEDQMRIVYGKEGIMASANGTEFAQNEDFEQIFENEIRILGKMTEKEFLNAHKKYHQHVEKRQKRQADDIWDKILPMTHQPQLLGIRVLNPFSFTTRIRNSNVMGPYILSSWKKFWANHIRNDVIIVYKTNNTPFAFYLQVVSASLLHMEIMSPRAFIATTFSPVLLTARVLSPSAFRLMLFSPLALVVWVMVPEAFLAKIFAPKLLDARILSPESFSFILLSPAAGVLRAGSPNTMNMLVLSPSFGTYQLFSGNRHVIQVLSPGILGVDSHPILRETVKPGDKTMSAQAMLLPGQQPPQMTMIQTNQLPLNYGG